MAVQSDRLDAICRIPQALATSKRSLRDVVSDSGYRGLRPELTRENLTAHLARHPKVVLDWLRYSANKRSAGGWYLMHPEAAWVVGRLGGSEQERDLRFGSGPEACAEFILRELDDVADGAVGASRSD